MCFVWISEQTAIISLYNINWLVFITETECVYWAVRTGYLKIFMCFVWISEQTAIISLYNINWLVCITETACVYCAVRTGYLDTIRIKFSLGGVLTHVVNRLRPNSKTRFWSQFSPSEIFGGQSSSGTDFSSCTSVSFYQNYSISAPHSSSSTRCSYQKDKRAKPENLAKSNVLSETFEHWIQKFPLSLFFESFKG